jgi:DNA helicase-2/ATP-dependent DNA helicase PcrA
MSSSVLDGLTPSQVEAARHIDGPLLVVAGAGSGKTRVITRRIAYLVELGVPAYRILAITFTNKAAEEMKHRVEQLTGAKGAWVSTFHSMCARMLRQFQDLLGFSNPFTIYDREDSRTAVRDVMKALGFTDRMHPGGRKLTPQSVLSAIGRAKNKMWTPDDVLANARGSAEQDVSRIYAGYERTLHGNNALDFDDLLLRTAQLLDSNESFRGYWQQRFEYILIDEYQDTNRPQYVIARAMAASHRNICATGDPDQSIYSWRGADIANILDFQKDYPGAMTVKLEENFRSTKMILEAASGVIGNNRERIERGLWTNNDAGPPVQVVASADDEDQAESILRSVRAAADDGIAYGDMAVFYRTHAQSRVIEDAFRDAGVPYGILDAVEFYNRREIKDVIAYLKVLLNPADAVGLARIINVPRRGIGTKTVGRLLAHAGRMGMSVSEALADAANCAGLNSGAVRKLLDFAAMMARFRELPPSPVAPIVRSVLEETGYLTRLRKSADEEDEARAENVEELVNAAAGFDQDYPGADIGQFLERVTLVSDSDAITGEGGKVMLMTLHSAKGLEFSVVCISGVQEGLLPHMNALGSRSRIEEERRLCYVGMTRAKQRLCLHWAAEHFTYGQAGDATASRFIEEIPDSAKNETGPRGGRHRAYGGGPASALYGESALPFSGNRPKPRTRQHGERVIEYDNDVVEYTTDSVQPGCRVRHREYGEGRVLSVSGSGDQSRIEIDFGGRRRALMRKFANLIRLD